MLAAWSLPLGNYDSHFGRFVSSHREFVVGISGYQLMVRGKKKTFNRTDVYHYLSICKTPQRK